MSEEFYAAIIFQHRNLLHLVDILRNKNSERGEVIKKLVETVRESQDDKRSVALPTFLRFCVEIDVDLLSS
jgi:hypothetical protein